MQDNVDKIADKYVLKSFYYSDPSKLNTRLEIWKKYGTNKLPINKWIIDSIVINNNSSFRLLDIGCGTGELINLIGQKHQNTDIHGLDMSNQMVALSKRNNPNCNILQGNAEQLPYDSNFFDYVVAVHLLHHIANIEQSIKEMMRVAKPGSKIFIVTGNYDLNTGLNKIHYESLAELGFPNFMMNRSAYLRFTRKEATQHLKRLKIKAKELKYVNNLCFREAEPVIDYYKSAMMYRNSSGPTDARIAEEQWIELERVVTWKIRNTIAKDGYFIIPGEVIGFKILRNE